MNDRILELFHHGIDKQRWGVRNGPPYPLNQKTHNRIVSGKQDKELKKYDKKKVGISHLGDQSHRRYRQVEDFENLERTFVRDGQTLTRTFGSDSNNVNVASLIARSPDDDAAFRTLDRPGHRVTYEDVADVNIRRRYVGAGAHNDGKYDAGLSNNCAMCSAALFLRGMGYEVQAGAAAYGCKNTAGEYWFDGARTYKTKGAQALYQQLQSFGNQGKGMLGVRHKNGSGHSVYFQMEKQADGKLRPTIYDGQIAKKYDSISQFLRAENADMSQFCKVTRLDGATPNWKHLAEDSVIRYGFAADARRKVIDDKTNNIYLTKYFRFANQDFDRKNAIRIGEGRVSVDSARRWLAEDAPQETLAGIKKDQEARAYLKEKYGL